MIHAKYHWMQNLIRETEDAMKPMLEGLYGAIIDGVEEIANKKGAVA